MAESANHSSPSISPRAQPTAQPHITLKLKHSMADRANYSSSEEEEEGEEEQIAEDRLSPSPPPSKKKKLSSTLLDLNMTIYDSLPRLHQLLRALQRIRERRAMTGYNPLQLVLRIADLLNVSANASGAHTRLVIYPSHPPLLPLPLQTHRRKA